MKQAIYLIALIGAALVLPARGSADSFTFSLDGDKTQTDLSSFAPDHGKNGFMIEVAASSPLAFTLFVDSLFKSTISAVYVDDFKVVDGHHEFSSSSEFEGDAVTNFSLGFLDRFHFSFKHDPLVLSSMPEPSAFLLLGSGIVGLGFLKRRLA